MYSIRWAIVLLALLGTSRAEAQVYVEDIHAHPFCEQEGRVSSQDLLADGPEYLLLWNSVIGEGAIECSSKSTLVVVAVVGPPGEYLGDTRLDVSITIAGFERDSTFTPSFSLGITTREGRYFVPVWLDNTGCDPVTIRAWIGEHETQAREETIQFRCGE